MSNDHLSPCVRERYTSATRSSNLRDGPNHHATDILAAMAWSGGFGAILIRLKIGLDHTSYPQAIEQWRAKVTEMADKKHWPTRISPDRVANESMKYWLNNICDGCTGLRYVKHEKSPTLQSEMCPCCDGTGVKPMPFAAEIRRYAIDALTELAEIDRLVGIEASKLMRNTVVVAASQNK